MCIVGGRKIKKIKDLFLNLSAPNRNCTIRFYSNRRSGNLV